MAVYKLVNVAPYNRGPGYVPYTLYVDGAAVLDRVDYNQTWDYVRTHMQSGDTYQEQHSGKDMAVLDFDDMQRSWKESDDFGAGLLAEAECEHDGGGE